MFENGIGDLEPADNEGFGKHGGNFRKDFSREQ